MITTKNQAKIGPHAHHLKTFTPAQYDVLCDAVAYYEATLEDWGETRKIAVLNRALDVADQLR